MEEIEGKSFGISNRRASGFKHTLPLPLSISISESNQGVDPAAILFSDFASSSLILSSVISISDFCIPLSDFRFQVKESTVDPAAISISHFLSNSDFFSSADSYSSHSPIQSGLAIKNQNLEVKGFSSRSPLLLSFHFLSHEMLNDDKRKGNENFKSIAKKPIRW